MPLKTCSQDGKSGWKWGDQGHCYIGKDAKKLALKNGLAIEGPEKFKQIMKTEGEGYLDQQPGPQVEDMSWGEILAKEIDQYLSK